MSCTSRMRQQKYVESLYLTCLSRSWILLASPALSFAFLCCSLALLLTSIFSFSTCSVSLWVSAVAARSLAASLSSSSWFSAYHCSLFFSSVTSSRCFSWSIFSSKPLSPARYIQMLDAIKMTITLLKIDCCHNASTSEALTWCTVSLKSGKVPLFPHHLQVYMQGLFLLF